MSNILLYKTLEFNNFLPSQLLKSIHIISKIVETKRGAYFGIPLLQKLCYDFTLLSVKNEEVLKTGVKVWVQDYLRKIWGKGNIKHNT